MHKLLFFLFIPIWLFGQSARDYFPVHLGDLWQYIDEEGNYINYTVVKDSIDSLGNEHAFIKFDNLNVPGSYTEEYVIDTLDQVWIINSSYQDGKGKLYDLQANYGEWYFIGVESNGENSWAVVRDTTINTKTYNFYYCDAVTGDPDSALLWGGYDVLQAGIGRVYSIGEFWHESLSGAIIDSVQYGTIYYDTTGIVHESSTHKPQSMRISSAYPNPFNGRIKLVYGLVKTRQIKVEIYSLLGQKIRELFNDYQAAGEHAVFWDGRNETGQVVNSGVYLVKLTASNQQSIKRIILIK